MRTDTAVLLDRLRVTVDPALMTLALTHRSYAYENGGLPTNERLEFLGDSVLGIVVTETLYSQYPDWPEGQLAKLRAAVVNAGALADVARSLDLGEYLYLGRGEETTGGRDKSSILADTMEAVFGAVFLDSGIDTRPSGDPPPVRPPHRAGGRARRGPGLEDLAAGGRRGRGARACRSTTSPTSGPTTPRSSRPQAVVGGEVLGEGAGRSKKVAEQRAAATAYARVLHDHPALEAHPA